MNDGPLGADPNRADHRSRHIHDSIRVLLPFPGF
jgi:hypothetical protein